MDANKLKVLQSIDYKISACELCEARLAEIHGFAEFVK